MTDAAQVILDRTERSGECWLWIPRANPRGYGTIRFEGRMMGAHRLAYEAAWGPIPDGLVIDHLCNVTACCNPLHLRAVTQSENVRRGTAPAAINARKTHCKWGHPFTSQNTYIRRDGSRSCRLCQRVSSRRYKTKQLALKAAAAA